MNAKKGWSQKTMVAAFLKEASYDAGVAMNASNACWLKGVECVVDWPDKLKNDKGDVTGTEHGTAQEVTEKRVSLSLTENDMRPNTLAFLAALCLGGITSTQDGALAAYRHKLIPVAVGTGLPSTQAETLLGEVQYAFKGVKGKSFSISGKEGESFSVKGELIGSGTRATSATAFVAAITENYLRTNAAKAWLETGANISIAATLTQHLEDISSATPENLALRIQSMDFSWDNDTKEQPGFGGAGVLQGVEYGRRKGTLKATLLHVDGTELGYYTAQDTVAIEIDCKLSSLIAGGGTLYWGFHLIIPSLRINKAAWPKGGVGDDLTVELDGDIYDDGTNAAVIVEVYNAKAAYLA